MPRTLWFDLSLKQTIPSEVQIVSGSEFLMSCFSSVLHYGQSIFEGLKVYHLKDGKAGIFRLDDHAKRFRRSAQIMRMPDFDEETFKECVIKYVENCLPFIPREENHSLYLRPLMFASDPMIKVKSSENYRFILMSSIAGSYFTGGKEGAKVFCHKQFVRAFPYGTGEAKTAANYALSLPDLYYAQELGFEQVLYLDALTKTKIDELGGMNFFMIKDNRLITPHLDGTILSGFTRDSILKIATFLGYDIEERAIALDEVLDAQAHQGIFACGTAATIVPIIELGYQSQESESVQHFKFPIHPLVKELRDHLVKCHKNMSPLSEKWLTIVP